MSDLNLVMSQLEEQNKKLDKIEVAITQMAVQGNQIVNLQSQVDALFKKYDDFWGPQGGLVEMQRVQTTTKAKQESCQVGSLSNQIKVIWGSILAMAMTIITKLFNS